MPALSIIPAQAVMDQSVSATQLRVLCAIGTHTNRLGGNVWASVSKLAEEAGVSSRTVQRAVEELCVKGYLRRIERPGRTSIFEVVLDIAVDEADPKVVSPPTKLCHPTPDKAVSPERYQLTITTDISPAQEVKDNHAHNEKHRALVKLTAALEEIFPKRPDHPPFPALLKAIADTLEQGAQPDQLTRAASRYAAHCLLNNVDPQYIRSMPRFFRDGYWKQYDVLTVYGRTREEWARSGQDVAEFDQLAEQGVSH